MGTQGNQRRAKDVGTFLDSHRAHLRIVDANLNRAREALRVLEEYARFALDDAALSGAIKELRHELARCVPETLKPALARARDLAGDVGREVATTSEYERADPFAVARAAGKRLSEALRAVEEYGKIVDAALASRVERIRYRGYDLERRLIITVDARKRFGPVRLYVIITESLCGGDWFETSEAALQGGADCLQLREKGLSDRELLERARRLASLGHAHGALLIVNNRPDIAALSGADGVHLGQDDMDVASARRMLPPSGIVGLSTHTVQQVSAAAAEAPDYIAVGPVFATATKPLVPAVGPGLLAAARARTSLPLVAIGGIDENNVRSVLGSVSGDLGLCVCRSVIAQKNVSGAASRLRALLQVTQPGSGERRP